MNARSINPESLGTPRGYSNGILAPAGGRLLFVAGQIGWNAEQKLVGEAFSEQFAQALANVLEVVREAGGAAEDVARLTIYVTDKREYAAELRAVGERYRSLMGKHYPAMSLVEVQALLEPGAKVEIEATAVLAHPP
jgi:enamine deaminase RidA (YjgF/YER057c/UK114 family)